jgi:hypothetical protein
VAQLTFARIALYAARGFISEGKVLSRRLHKLHYEFFGNDVRQSVAPSGRFSLATFPGLKAWAVLYSPFGR